MSKGSGRALACLTISQCVIKWQGDIKQGWIVEIIGYVHNSSNDQEGLQTLVNQIYSDLILALYNDRTLGGSVSTLAVTRFEKVVHQDGVKGAIYLEVTLKFDFRPEGSIT